MPDRHKDEWWQDFFTGGYGDVQGQVKSLETTREEANAIERFLQLPPGAKVLDVPCGEGRLSLELASRGHHLTGVDVTPHHIEDARRQAAERKLEVAWEHRDMRDLPWRDEFDAAICMGGSFGYFNEAGNSEFVDAVGKALKPGGKFLIDNPAAESILPRFQPRDWHEIGDTLVLQDRRWDHTRGRVDGEWTFVQAGKVEKRRSSVRLYTYHELCQLLEGAGFGQFAGFGSLDQEPFELGSRRLYLVAEKV